MTKEVDIVELAGIVNGRIIGEFKDVRIRGTCAIDKYVKNKLSFIRNKKYDKSLSLLQNAIIIIPKDLIEFTEKYSIKHALKLFWMMINSELYA